MLSWPNNPPRLSGRWLWCASLLAIHACTAHSAFADGKFFPHIEAADDPTIRSQHAAIIYRDGIETLIVQSDVEATDETFGWLLPVPAEPTAVEACHPLVLKALNHALQPDFVQLPRALLFGMVLLLLLVGWHCVDVTRRRKAVTTTSPGRITALIIVILFFLLVLPTLSERGAAGVNVLQTKQAGIYDIAVIKGDTAEAVQDWLAANDFVCSSAEKAAITEYVTADWCFLAAKVTPDARGTATHHPLKVTFPAAQAVYPMRLTGVEAEPIQLDLFIIGDRQAIAQGMQTWVCDALVKDTRSHGFEEYLIDIPPRFETSHGHGRIASPALAGLIAEGDRITRLHGRLSVEDMQDDLRIGWRAPHFTQARVYGQTDALIRSMSIALGFFACGLLVITWHARRTNRNGLQPLLTLLALTMLVGGGQYALLDVVPTRTDALPRWILTHRALFTHAVALQEVVAAVDEELAFPEAYRQTIDEQRSFIRYEEDPAQLDHAGDYAIAPSRDGWRLMLIDGFYTPIAIHIDEQGVPRRAEATED